MVSTANSLTEESANPHPTSRMRRRVRFAPTSRKLGWIPLTGEWLVVLAGLVILVGWPFGRLLWEAFSTPGVLAHLWSQSELTAAIRGTVVTSLGAMVFALVVGGGAAIAFWRLQVPGQKLLMAGLLLPILVPPFICALSITQTYTAAGLTDHIAGLHFEWLFGAAGTTVVLGVQQVPIAFLIIAAAAHSRGGADMERAARASGANAWVSFRTVTFPLLRPAILAAAALSFIAAASDFGVPAVLAIPARYSTITTQIYRAMAFASGGLADPITLSALLIVVALVVLGAAARFNRATTMGSRASAPGVVRRRPWHVAVSLLLGLYVVLVSVFPLFGLAGVALTRVYGESPAPSHWALNNIRAALTGVAAGAFGRSLLLSVCVASVLVVAAVFAGRLGMRRGGRAVAALITVPYAVPGSAVAVAILLTFGKWWYGGLFIIAVAYMSRFWALAQQPIAAALGQVNPEPARAARASGASALRAWWVSTWPAIRPSILAGWLLVFLSCLHELTVSVLLYVPGRETIGVVVLNAEQGGDLASTSAIALVLTIAVLLCALPLVVSRRLRSVLGFTAGGAL